jgi:pimeloyl-ACP methyl ester carboxylesterase
MNQFLKRRLLFVVSAFVIAYGAIVCFLYFDQTELVYRANPVRVSAKEAGLENVTELSIATPDGETMQAWYSAAQPNKPTILFCHGKGGNMASRSKRWRYYVERGYGVMFFDYHGFGGSTGIPTEEYLRMDVKAAYDWLSQQAIKSKDIALVGESLGTGVCTMLAAKMPAASLELEAAYSSIVDIAAERYWWAPVHWLIKDRFDATLEIANIHSPLLQQHGDADETIPVHFGQTLFAAAISPKEFVLVPGGGHVLGPQAWQRGLDFIDAVRAGTWKPKE